MPDGKPPQLQAASAVESDPDMQGPPAPGMMFAGWVGPLPPPAMLRQFAEIVPEGAERIYRQFELEAEHRRDQEKSELRLKRASIHIGQVLAAAFVAGVLILIYLIRKDSPEVASVLAGGTIVSGIVAFLRTRGGT